MRMRPIRPASRSLGLAGTILVAVLAAAGCANPSTTPRSTPVPPTSAPSSPLATPADASPSLAASPAPSPSGRPIAPGDPAAVALSFEPLVDGLEAPVFATGAGDGSGRLFVVEQPGRIRVIRDGRLLERSFLDIADRVSCCGERGLLGLAFEPGDPSRFFVDYTDRDGNTVVSSFRVGASDPDAAEPASEQVVLSIVQPYPNHNGGMLAFGPDGYLYVGMGDGGSGGDPEGNGQDLAAQLGKLLRIDATGSSDRRPYVVPPDNPYVGVADAAPEVWALGLRNPWRFSFDRSTGDLWIGDVGQNAYEEVDRARAADGGGRGANYGWNRMEGSHCYPSGDRCDLPGMILPIAEYGHDQGCAVTGGYVYRGAAQPALAGVYLFADYCTGNVWGLSSGGPERQDPVTLATSVGNVASFGEDDAGELYAVDLAGRLLRIVARAG